MPTTDARLISSVRPAGHRDVDELVRLRHEMFRGMAAGGSAGRPEAVEDSTWRPGAASAIARRMADGDLAAFVVDHPAGPPRLAACAVATIEQLLPGPGFPAGTSGRMSTVYVDPCLRRRGLARAVSAACLAWLVEQGAEVVDLHATPAAVPVYRSLGFSEPRSLPMRGLSEAQGEPPRAGTPQVRTVSAGEQAVRDLVDALTDELAASGYSQEQTFGYPVEQLEVHGVHLVGAEVGGRLVAVAGVQLDGPVAELKRFYVVPAHRGSGVADALLDALVHHAGGRGAQVIRLETGARQEAAIRFYGRRGFLRVPRFGPYVDSATSVCMARALTDSSHEG